MNIQNGVELTRMTIDVPKSFHRIVKSTASMQGETIRNFVIQALKEKIEDQIDLREGLKALEEFEAGNKKTYTLEEMRKSQNT
jgi:hypothetical protein